jgi:translation initiation factor 2 alpha subunit (eIF-2alpha)
MAGGTRYTVTLPPRVEKDLEDVAESLQIPKSEAFRRALTLLKHAADADEVILKKDNQSKTVLVK